MASNIITLPELLVIWRSASPADNPFRAAEAVEQHGAANAERLGAVAVNLLQALADYVETATEITSYPATLAAIDGVVGMLPFTDSGNEKVELLARLRAAMTANGAGE